MEESFSVERPTKNQPKKYFSLKVNEVKGKFTPILKPKSYHTKIENKENSMSVRRTSNPENLKRLLYKRSKRHYLEAEPINFSKIKEEWQKNQNSNISRKKELIEFILMTSTIISLTVTNETAFFSICIIKFISCLAIFTNFVFLFNEKLIFYKMIVCFCCFWSEISSIIYHEAINLKYLGMCFFNRA